jgi:hypothetical protein
MESEDLRPQDQEGHVAGEAEDAVNSLKSWVKPIYPDVVVFPKQEIALDFTIEVPANADPGTHWGSVVVQCPFQREAVRRYRRDSERLSSCALPERRRKN